MPCRIDRNIQSQNKLVIMTVFLIMSLKPFRVNPNFIAA